MLFKLFLHKFNSSTNYEFYFFFSSINAEVSFRKVYIVPWDLIYFLNKVITIL